jgi:hypothetical protein
MGKLTHEFSYIKLTYNVSKHVYVKCHNSEELEQILSIFTGFKGKELKEFIENGEHKIARSRFQWEKIDEEPSDFILPRICYYKNIIPNDSHVYLKLSYFNNTAYQGLDPFDARCPSVIIQRIIEYTGCSLEEATLSYNNGYDQTVIVVHDTSDEVFYEDRYYQWEIVGELPVGTEYVPWPF